MLRGALQERLRAGLHGEARVLLRLGPCDGGNALDEVEDADEERLLALVPTRTTNTPRLAVSRRITYRSLVSARQAV